MSFTREGDRCRALASAFTLMPRGLRYSSLSTSPGCTGRMPFLKPIPSLLLVVLCDLYVRWTRLRPNKTDSPLIINPYAVLSRSIPGQRLKSVSRRRLQVLECRRRIKHPELSRSKLTNRSKLLGPVRFKEFLCIGALEPLNWHASYGIPFTGIQQGLGLAAKTDSLPRA